MRKFIFNFFFCFILFSDVDAFDPLKDIEKGLGGVGNIINEGLKQIEKELNQEQQKNQIGEKKNL